MRRYVPNASLRSLLRHLLVAVGICGAAAGCISMPNAGPVLPYGVTPSVNGQPQANLQIVPQPPGADWGPADIVSGFLEASASFVGQQQVAREYLTPTASRGWRPGWTATVFKEGQGPDVLTWHTSSGSTASGMAPRRTPSPKATASASSSGPTASVIIGGSVQATLYGSGAYAVASAPPEVPKKFTYDLIKYRGQWRISNLNGNPLLLTRPEFMADYQLRNLYFFDPSGEYLVPDPVYVPLRAPQEDLMNGLVGDLITQPRDWLAGGATRTAFPKGTTRLGNVVVDGGTASVNLGGTASKATSAVEEQISAQLLSTLHGAGQGQQQVKSVELSVNGHPFSPSGAQGNPVQSSRAKYSPPAGPDIGFYYVDSHGQLMRQQQTGTTSKPVKIADIGHGYSALAVSPDGDYVAALRDGQVYTGPANARSLSQRAVGGGVTSLSWDGDDNLWTTGTNSVNLLTASAKPSTPPVAVTVYSPQSNCDSPGGEITALRVAPDGVRVAIVFSGPEPTLAFGAIVMQEASQAGHPRSIVTITLSPFCVPGSPGPSSFKAVSWFGADNVVALEPGDSLTEYPVNGGTPTTIPGPPPGIQSITASGGSGGGLIASAGDGLYFTPTVTGPWTSVSPGKLAAYPGLEIRRPRRSCPRAFTAATRPLEPGI